MTMSQKKNSIQQLMSLTENTWKAKPLEQSEDRVWITRGPLSKSSVSVRELQGELELERSAALTLTPGVQSELKEQEGLSKGQEI
ncbi:hypothetical protein EYF80_057474 [Liparis tanakae]|uniref:Uncharacterized protein n=1 Tax=Liparis tanakae TaxID=230148 RepID=A0A4Z2EU94_9TELE|nr:hypothetical protein EYF80_057474 [Liparis tanakae]